MKTAGPCDHKTQGRKSWVYDEYYLGSRDKEERRSDEGENHWTTAQSIEWYRGEFTRDTMHGYGHYRWRYRGSESEFVTYEGYFYVNKLHGYGSMSYPDVRTFIGLYYKDVRWGPGVHYHDLHQDVGLWRGDQLVRLAWRPKGHPIAPDLPSGVNGKALVERFRKMLAKETEVIGKTNSAIDQLKEVGMHPIEASINWSKLYAKNCTDLRSPACDVNAFKKQYYEGKVELIRPVTRDDDIFELSDNKYLFYAWNNNKMMIHMMQHSFKHNSQREKINIDLNTILNAPRNRFRPPGSHERDARTMLMCCYLGSTWDVVQFVNESNIYPDITDNLGNSALVYATCGGDMDLIRFLVEAGANVNGMNDSCCTPLSIALMRYACARQGQPLEKITQVVLPRENSYLIRQGSITSSMKSIKPIKEEDTRPSARDWLIKRITPRRLQPSIISRKSTSPDLKIKLTTSQQSKASVSRFNSTSEPNLATKSASFISKQRVKETYDSDDSTSPENEMYSLVTREYTKKMNKEFSTGSHNPEYLFRVNDDTRIQDLNEEEEIEFVTPKYSQRDVNMLWMGGCKRGLDSLSIHVPEYLPQMLLTITELLNNGADPRLVRCPQPAMLLAVASGCPDLVKFLVSHGADVNETFPAALNYNALEIAMLRPLSLENIVFIEALLESGADGNHRMYDGERHGPTVMHVLLAKETHTLEEEDLVEATLNLLIKYNCNPFAQFMGHSPMDIVLSKHIHFLDVFLRSPKIKWNEVINYDNQTTLVKIFSLRFFEFFHWRVDLNPVVTELLLRGADPLIPCQYQGKTYENIFEFIKLIMSEFNGGPSVSVDRKSSKQVGQGDVGSLKKGGTMKRKNLQQKTGDVSKIPLSPVKASKQIGQGDVGPLKKRGPKKKKSLQKETNVEQDYRMAVELLTGCVGMMHVKWLQSKLVQELVAVVYKYKHRWWHLIIKEHKNQTATAAWVTPQRFLEIWDILKTKKKKVYNDELTLKATLCILHLYQRRKCSLPMDLKATVTVKDEIQSDVCIMMLEHKFMSISAELEATTKTNDGYVQAELERRNTDKYNICFECCMPLQKEHGIVCPVCQSVFFCSLECARANDTRLNRHLCNDIQTAYWAESRSVGRLGSTGSIVKPYNEGEVFTPPP